ncbi:hypothetical protein MHYP_G00121220 [Metynnis hypsauchen]
MSGATGGSRSATDPISGSGRSGRLQHLKNTRAARRAGGAWEQASSRRSLWDVWRKKWVQGKVHQKIIFSCKRLLKRKRHYDCHPVWW